MGGQLKINKPNVPETNSSGKNGLALKPPAQYKKESRDSVGMFSDYTGNAQKSFAPPVQQQTTKNRNPVAQLIRKFPVDPLTQGDAVAKRREIENSQKCVGTAKVKQDGTWSDPFTAVSSGTPGPQAHAERVGLEHFVAGMVGKPGQEKPFGKNLNIQEGKDAGDLLKNANVTDIEVYTELPPCWGCDPWLTEIDKKIDGEVVSTNSLLLNNYYNHYDTLKNIVSGNHMGLNILRDYDINYVLGRIDIATDKYNMLKTNNYSPYKIALKGSTELDDKIDALTDIACRNYESIKLMGMEVGSGGYYYDLKEALIRKIKKTNPLRILNNFENVKSQVEQEEAEMFQKIKDHHSLKMSQLDFEEEEREEEVEEEEDLD